MKTVVNPETNTMTAMKLNWKLQHEVLSAIDFEPIIEKASIGVTADAGVVTLSGYVRSYGNKRTVERASLAVEGVKAVADELEVKLESSHERSDTELAQVALEALKWHVAVPHESIQLTVQNGWLTLEGTVENHYQKRAAERALQHLIGLQGMDNRLVIKRKHQSIPDQDIRKRIEDALARNVHLEAEKLNVKTVGGRAILRGKVHSWWEREEAESAALAAPGITIVENHIAVTD